MDLASSAHQMPAVTLSEPTHDAGDHFEVPVNIPVKIIHPTDYKLLWFYQKKTNDNLWVVFNFIKPIYVHAFNPTQMKITSLHC
jgi:hypothetical protein